MADVKWIKIVTDIFDDEKILLIEAMPEADSLITIWFKLLCLAGKQNNSGVFLLNDRIPYTDEMFATIFRRKLNTVRLALNTFENLGMIEIVNGTVTIPNWGKHQSLERLEAEREYQRNYHREYRARQKLLAAGEEVEGKGLRKGLRKDLHKADVKPPDKDIDKDKDLYNNNNHARARDNPFSDEYEPVDPDPVVGYAARVLVGLSPNNIDELVSFRDSLPDDVIIYAIDETAANGTRNYSYTRKILNEYVRRGFKSIGDIKAYEDKRKGGVGNGDHSEPATEDLFAGLTDEQIAEIERLANDGEHYG